MLSFRNITFTMEGNRLIDEASVVIPTGHKVGLVGRNGTGKTTLFKLIRGELTLDGGEISVPKGLRIGGVAQEAPAGPDSLIERVLAADVERVDLLARAETETDPMQIAEIQTRLVDIDAHSAQSRAATILSGLGFDHAAQGRPCSDFSGGWRMRVALASVLFARPDILLLDEPTNYLDLEGTLWLEAYLARYPHTIVVISHDRQLLNRAVGAILHLHGRKLTLYQGNYDTFDNTRRAKLMQQAAAKKKQDAERAHMMAYVDRFRYKASKARQAQSRLKALARMQPIAAILENKVAGFNFPTPESLSPPIVRLESADVGYNGQPVLRNLELRIDQDDRIALLGANGQGKSTLSKLIAGRLKPMGGVLHASSKLRIGYFAQHQIEELTLGETPLDHLRHRLKTDTPAKLRSRLAAGGMGPDIVDTEVSRLSGGEKARLSLLLATMHAPHLIILDEPTNHLDIESREALVLALNDYNGAVILVSHDAHLVECIADRLWLVKDGQVTEYRDDLDAYRRLLLGGRPKGSKENSRKPSRNPSQQGPASSIAKLRGEVTRCEERLAKLESIRNTVNTRLARSDIWKNADPGEIEKWQRKHTEVIDGLARAENLWIRAQELLDDAERGSDAARRH